MNVNLETESQTKTLLGLILMVEDFFFYRLTHLVDRCITVYNKYTSFRFNPDMEVRESGERTRKGPGWEWSERSKKW